MARASTSLNFPGTTLEAFEFYRSVFGAEFIGPILRMGDIPASPDGPAFAESEADMVMHIELPILAGHVLMGTDVVPSMGHQLVSGNNVEINLEPDTRIEADRLHAALGAGGSASMAMMELFWGGAWGSCTDRFGIAWMVNCYESS